MICWVIGVRREALMESTRVGNTGAGVCVSENDPAESHAGAGEQAPG